MDTKTNIILISYNNATQTIDCIKSILETCINAPGLIIVDNASADDTVMQVLKRFPDAQVIENDKNLGYAKAVNIGAAKSDAEILVVSNTDVVYHPGCLDGLIKYLSENPGVAVAGPQQLYGDGSWEYSYGNFPGLKMGLRDLLMIESTHTGIRKFLWPETRLDKVPKKVDYIDGAIMAIRKSVFDELGGFDEDFFFYTEEAEFCFRVVKSGYDISFVPYLTATHYRGGDIAEKVFDEKSAEMMIGSKLLFCSKHRTSIETKIYSVFEMLSSLKNAWIWRFFSLFASGNRKTRLSNKSQSLKNWFKTWKKLLKVADV